jgi:hypothetical protein
MAASPPPLLPQATSTSSSGFADGLGRRELAFDREEGVMLERLVLRPELGAFETALRERIDRLAALEDERLARPRTIEREPNGGLVVVSEFVPGSRLSDLLETSADLGNVPGVDAALGFLLDVLPALCGLHAGGGFSHGTITPSRIVLTPAGQIVLLDGIYGCALSHLRYSRSKLWIEFGIATAASSTAPPLDAGADIAQAALAAVMLVLGRPLSDDEYSKGLSRVLREVVETAQIRSTAAFAEGLQDFLERALAMPSQAPYDSADDALFDVRQLANELGAQVCRRALVDFIEQMESPSTAAAAAEYDEVAGEIENYRFDESGRAVEAVEEPGHDLNAGVDAELDLDSLVEDVPFDIAAAGPAEIHQTGAPTVDDEAVDWVQLAAASEAQTNPSPVAIDRGHVDDTDVAASLPPESAPAPPGEASIAEPEPPVVADPIVEAAAAADPEVGAAPAQPVAATPPAAVEDPQPAPASDPETDAEPAPPLRSRRAKRLFRSARARKDKLRSASQPQPELTLAPAPEPAPVVEPKPEPAPAPKKPSMGGWLVAPDRAAAFEPAVPIAPAFEPPPAAVASAPAAYTPPPAPQAVPLYAAPPPPPPPPPPRHTPPPPANEHPPDPFFTPSPPQPPPDPFFSRTVGSIAPSYSTPPWTPPPVSAPSPQLVTAKLKDPEPRPRAPRAPDASDIYGAAPAPVVKSEPTAFPWKLAAAAAGIMVVAVVGGHIYMPAKGGKTEAVKDAAPAAATPPPVQAAPAAVVATSGRLEIDTQPAGARILIDGKAAGESPVALDGIAAGRHTITFISASGSVKRTVRVEAGRTTKLDVPIFSGWVGIYAPFVVEVAEGGKVIGTTEDPRIMLSPGKHDLTLVNRELGYSSNQNVDVEPGEVRSISIDPRGFVNLNATPWAEVWIDGRKAGDTPLANLQLPLGVREIIFRHPQLGERRVTVTVKGNAPAAVSIDMNKPQP